MNKELKKKLIQEYKKKDLEEDLSSDNSLIVNIAKLKLGLFSNPVTEEVILNVPDSQLINLIYNKINEVAELKYQENPKKHGSRENIIRYFSSYLQLIYYTHEFEMLLEIGDCDKYFNDIEPEIVDIVAESYSMIDFRNLSFLITDVANGNAETCLLETEYERLKLKIQKNKIDFVRKNTSQFLLK